MICYQYQKRLEYSEKEKDNPYWLEYDLDLKKSVIKPIEFKLARDIIEQYEYLGGVSAISMFCFGIFFPHRIENKEICGGVVIFGEDYSKNLGMWDKYGFTDKIILLNRGVGLHWTPINTASKLIMGAIKLLPEKYKVITATVDRQAGEIGTIYQSCNFHYVGVMRKVKTRSGYMIDGKLYGSRSIRAKYGTMKKNILKSLVPNIEFVTLNSKERYFYFIGSKTEIKHNKLIIKEQFKEYPKRD